MKKVQLKGPVKLFERNEEEPTVHFEDGQILEVLYEYDNEEYFSGKVLVLFDGKEACSVDAGLVEEVIEQ